MDTVDATTIGVLHPGEMGAAVAAAARDSGARVVWCRHGRSAASAARAEAAGLEALDSLAALVGAADVVLAICPPAAAAATAEAVCAHGFRGVYVDANAVGTTLLQHIRGTVTGAGATFVDAALFGSRRPGDPIRLHLAGDTAPTAVVAALLAPGHGVAIRVLDGPAGAASALKMAHSAFQKAARPLAALAYALAAAHGVSEALLAEAEGMGSPLAEPDALPVAASKAWRWEPEMREVADSLADAGLPPAAADAAGDLLASWAPFRDERSTPLGTVLEALHTPGPVGS